MLEGFKNPDFLKKFPGLGNAEEITSAKKRTEERTGQKVAGDFASLIQNYLDRFTEHRDHLAEIEDDRLRERAFDRSKAVIMEKFVTKYENIPDTYWREKDEKGDMGTFYRELYEHGLSGDWANMDEEEKEKYKQDYAKTLIEDQRSSLEEWLDYFIDKELSGDIPDYLKYWIFRSLTSLQEYEKPKDWSKGSSELERTTGQFPRRAKNSLKKFPDLHPEALRYVTDALVEKHQGQSHEFGYDISEEERAIFKQYLEQESFAKLYSWAMESFNPIPEELLPITEGKWVKYPQGSDVDDIVKTLKGKGTGLCIAGKGAASGYLKSGDLYIFYSNDEKGDPTFPRIAIHAKEGEIAEVRGIANKQNLDPYMGDVAGAKLSEFTNGKEYEGKSEDMKRLTEVENKTKQGQALTKDDLVFLYEIEAPIRYFGMQKDPRIKELRGKRNLEEDAPVVLDCVKEEIALNQNEINEKTKAYIGPLFRGIFQLNLEHIYTSFPEGKIGKMEVRIGGESKESLIKEMKDNFKVSDYSSDMLNSPDFTVSPNPEKLDLVRLKVGDLGFPNGATTEEIYRRAEEFGLELCPAETGPQLRKQYLNQSQGEWLRIAMKQIAGRDGNPSVFGLARGAGGLWLHDDWAGPGDGWVAGREVVFRFRK
jgi:hypothetical protein